MMNINKENKLEWHVVHENVFTRNLVLIIFCLEYPSSAESRSLSTVCCITPCSVVECSVV
jgi:hypothetical protein